MPQNPYEPTSSYLATNVYSGNGATTSFTYSFDYLNKDTWTVNSPNTASTSYNAYLRLLVGDNEVPYTMTNATTLVAATAPASGTNNVRIVRNSSIAARKVDYVEGSTLTETNLDRDSKQAHFLVQELHDRLIDVNDWANDRYVNSYYFTANGATNTFDLNLTASNNVSEETTLLDRNDILVFLNGTLQQSRSGVYSTSLVGGVTRVTLDATPVNGTLIEVRTIVTGVNQRTTIAANDVTTATIADAAVTFAKTNFNGAGANNSFLRQNGSGVAVWTVPTASDISDFNTAVRTNRLDQMAAANTTVSVGTAGTPQKLQYVATPTTNNDAATKQYVDNLIVSSAPNYKISQTATNGATNVTVTCNFAWNNVKLTLAPSYETVAGATNNPYSYYNITGRNDVFHRQVIYTASTLGSAQTWYFASTTNAAAPTSANALSIEITKSGNDIVIRRTGQNTAINVTLFVEFIKDNS
jgi:hypothetical protein